MTRSTGSCNKHGMQVSTMDETRIPDSEGIPIPLSIYDSYRPIRELSHWLIIFLIGIAVLSVVSFGSGLLQLQLLAQIQAGVQVSPEVAQANDERQFVIAMMELGSMVTTGILFLTWMRRAYNNLPAFGMHDPTYSPGWAVWGFLIPFLNIIRPLQVMKELWRASDPHVRPEPGWVTARVSPLVGWWWGMYLIMNFVASFGMRLALEGSSAAGDLHELTLIDVIASALTIPAAVLAAGVVREIMVKQAQKREITVPVQG